MSIKFAILGLLQRKELHGYRIKQIIERDFGAMWTVNFGQIYPALSELREQGLVSMIEVPQPAAPSRKRYSITPQGRAAFAVWLDSEPERRMILRDPFLLRFPFYDLGDERAALHTLKQQIELYQGELRTREQQLAQRARMGEHARLVAELGLELNQTMLCWLKRAEAELETKNATLKPEQERAADRAAG